eukprot:CAMPEP_0118857998 /NCGR_PEP_ID=MMETSP1163-20130328/4865_1 /TAXON_ID=124430 /ORGANISM="Phaeomonas parva, Strain CCMP2877" /LENGTH=80 /DNA_ID=CAMNT_0006791401 /DNA_START=222 /DNA_END=465 /DNA_ORIENTATION=-
MPGMPSVTEQDEADVDDEVSKQQQQQQLDGGSPSAAGETVGSGRVRAAHQSLAQPFLSLQDDDDVPDLEDIDDFEAVSNK